MALCEQLVAPRVDETETAREDRCPAQAATYGVWLEASPGAAIDQSSVCANATTDAAGLRITGDATATTITRSDISAYGGSASATSNGIEAEDCGGASPWIADNHGIHSDGLPSASLTSLRATGDCHPLIEANLEIGGVEGSGSDYTGIVCEADSGGTVSSACTIARNALINGAANGSPSSTTGIRSDDGSCGQITENALIRGGAGANSIGLHLLGASDVLVERNEIEGGCAATSTVGVLGDDAAARLENNLIRGSETGCTNAGGDWHGLLVRTADGLNELDVHSNLVFGAGTSAGACTSTGVGFDLAPAAVVPTGPLGILRNNIIQGGSCPTTHAIRERDLAADPRLIESNDLTPALTLYLDETSNTLTSAAEVNALADTTATSNLDVTCVPADGAFNPLLPGSPCEDSGTPTAAPVSDYEFDARPQGAVHDIGPDERVP